MTWETQEVLPAITSSSDVLVVYGTSRTSDLSIVNQVLTRDEVAFGSRIRSIGERNTWISCHVALRIMLGSYLKSEPDGIELKKNRFGRLYLPSLDLYFNVSHTHSSWLLVFCIGNKIGADLETLSGTEDLASLVEYAFSSVEADYCKNGELRDRFLEIWTLKEAFLKAAGVGLLDNLGSVNVCGIEKNDILVRNFDHDTFLCPNGETASIVYRSTRSVRHVSLCS